MSMTSFINSASQPSIHLDTMFQPPDSLIKLLLLLMIDAGLQALHAKRGSLSAQFAGRRCLAVVKPCAGSAGSADPARTTEATPHPDHTIALENIFRKIMIHNPSRDFHLLCCKSARRKRN